MGTPPSERSGRREDSDGGVGLQRLSLCGHLGGWEGLHMGSVIVSVCVSVCCVCTVRERVCVCVCVCECECVCVCECECV